ncbi:glycogen debranching protein GlgX [uncultured Piscinibacter sp.]|uniref:glycogen debranching protein GlgX n=1 Tax=uncultured Piscinibacter sp. TaxID=1131835 RepID=UPI002603AF2A|nr:glycogen debranching protein GlgX [uncultured Piscinibacter sp.]
MENGHPWPLGAHWDGHGVNVAVFSAHAQRVDLCVFDDGGRQELKRLPLPARTQDVWHGYLRGAGPGLVYGLRAHGPWRPERGHRFNPHKLLLDPYAREIVGRFEWRAEHYGADARHGTHMDMRDNATCALKARVVDPRHDWRGDRHPHTPLERTVLYELHVKGFTQRHPGVPEALRGSYAGLASDAAIAHFKRLGVTALCLLPVHQRIDERRLVGLGLSNYWGYNSIGFFCPDARLASGADGLSVRDEFRAMVAKLHAHGLEVILDVVYNHTAEADEHGPTISFRGLDNASYYRLPHDQRERYENHSGCGNTLDLRQPRVLQMVLDSLRFWAGEMHVDGFRFDLAPVLGRGDHGFDRHAPFFTALAQDPLLSRLKMIAEPWDIGPGGYQLGGFPGGWLEWNDRFRDTMRAFWIEGSHTRGDFAQRLAASSDIFQPRHRAPAESVNYVVSHDGFTLADLVSFAHKHNEANGEHNRDGHGHNHSAHFGVEGPTDDAAIRSVRGRVARALLASTLLSQGTPMLCAGDEFGRSQGGNNNAYCQDNVTSWLDWSRADEDLIAFTARLLSLRRQALPFANRWYDGLPDRLGLQDVTWLRVDGSELHGEEWRRPDGRVFGCLIGRPGLGRTPLLLLVNGDAGDIDFMLPGGAWQAVFDSAQARGETHWQGPGEVLYPLAGRAMVVFAGLGHELDL